MGRRLAAILAADVVGYSRLMGADEGFVTNLRCSERALPVARSDDDDQLSLLPLPARCYPARGWARLPLDAKADERDSVHDPVLTMLSRSLRFGQNGAPDAVGVHDGNERETRGP